MQINMKQPHLKKNTTLRKPTATTGSLVCKAGPRVAGRMETNYATLSARQFEPIEFLGEFVNKLHGPYFGTLWSCKLTDFNEK